MTAAAVLVPGKRPFTISKRDTMVGIDNFNFSPGYLNKRLGNHSAVWHHLNGSTAAVC